MVGVAGKSQWAIVSLSDVLPMPQVLANLIFAHPSAIQRLLRNRLSVLFARVDTPEITFHHTTLLDLSRLRHLQLKSEFSTCKPAIAALGARNDLGISERYSFHTSHPEKCNLFDCLSCCLFHQLCLDFPKNCGVPEDLPLYLAL
jgi:hypothetical protein